MQSFLLICASVFFVGIFWIILGPLNNNTIIEERERHDNKRAMKDKPSKSTIWSLIMILMVFLCAFFVAWATRL
jgi:hypothetical protein